MALLAFDNGSGQSVCQWRLFVLPPGGSLGFGGCSPAPRHVWSGLSWMWLLLMKMYVFVNAVIGLGSRPGQRWFGLCAVLQSETGRIDWPNVPFRTAERHVWRRVIGGVKIFSACHHVLSRARRALFVGAVGFGFALAAGIVPASCSLDVAHQPLVFAAFHGASFE